jgi:hypothetical protein
MHRVAVIALVMLAACSRSPSSPTTSPSPVPGVAGVSGLWTGTFHLTDCTGDRNCIPFMITGSNRPFTLNVQQAGSHVVGSFTPGSVAQLDAGRLTADVTGEMNPDGWVTLSGTTPASAEDGSMRVTAVRVRATAGGGLEGRIAYETTPSLQASDLMLPSSYGGDIVSVARMK